MGLLSELDRQSIQIAKDPISSKQLEKVAEEMQQEIIKMQHRFQVLVQESTDVFEIIGPDGTIIYINDAVKRVMGYTPDERIGKNIFDFYHGKQLERIKDLVQDVLAKPSRKLEVEGPFRTKSGKNVILQIHMQNLLHDSYIGGFIKNIAKDETCSVIAGSIINMARELQIKAVAEGIESWEQLSELKSLNCHAGQGYLYSKAVEPLEFTKLLAKKKCRPIRTQNVDTPKKQRRKFFRVEFIQSLEAEMTILEIKGKKIDVGNTKVLVKDIGPGGLCFISNIKLPIVKDFIMLFKTELLGKELKLTGYPVWGGEKDSNLYTYGVEFILDENDRSLLIHDLNKIQIKMRKKSLFTDGSFVTVSPAIYFKQFNN